MSESPTPEQPARDPIWPLFGWAMFVLSLSILLIALLLGRVMRAIVLDVVSFWPAWVVAAVVALALWPLHRRGVARVGAIAPLLLFSWLTGAVGLHYSGWDVLPSAAGDLTGPSLNTAEMSELTVNVSGNVLIEPGTPQLYEVHLMRAGGDTGPAEALERSTESNVVVELSERSDAGWFESAGWEVLISRTPAWGLSIEAGELEADLATVSIHFLDVVADGEVRLSSPIFAEVPISVNGSLILRVPTGAPVRIIGDADVPSSWTRTAEGSESGVEGTATYVVTVVPGASLVVEHW